MKNVHFNLIGRSLVLFMFVGEVVWIALELVPVVRDLWLNEVVRRQWWEAHGTNPGATAWSLCVLVAAVLVFCIVVIWKTVRLPLPVEQRPRTNGQTPTGV